MEKLKKTANPMDLVLAKVRDLCPAAVQGDKIDFERLRSELEPSLSEENETYNFTWVGKRDAILGATLPVGKTLRPDVESSKNWDETKNLYIEGDNLDVLKLLQESYLGKVKMIYIDPPYNTGNDFVYCDNFAEKCKEYMDKKGQCDVETNERLFKNDESNGRYHSNWCTMIYPRLKVARDLLSDDGVIFISIDDNEQANLKKICDEVFGEDNFIGQMIRVSSPSQNTAKFMSIMHDYVLIYAKNILQNAGNWQVKKNYADEFSKRANDLLKMSLEESEIATQLRALTKYPKYYDFDHYNMCDKQGVFQLVSMGGVEKGNTQTVLMHPVTKKACAMPEGGWRYKEETLRELVDTNQIYYGNDENYVPRKKLYLKDYLTQIPKGIMFFDSQTDVKFLQKNHLPFDFPKPIDFVRYLVEMVNADKNSIILDFFSGSATTAHAVMQLNAEDGGNRRFIMVQLPEQTDEKSEAFKAGYKNICEIGKERIRRAGDKIMAEHPDSKLDIGFKVFKLDEPNMKTGIFNVPSAQTQAGLFENVENIINGRTSLDLLYDSMIKLGLTLDLDVKTVQSGDTEYFNVDSNSLIACFADQIPESIVHEIATLHPLRVVFRDSSFANDAAIINVTEIFKTISPITKITVL